MENKQEVSLVIDGQIFKVRKNMLSEHSDYFRAMFGGNYVENEQDEISMDVVDANSMNIILRYMELGLIDISEHPLVTVGQLAIAANFLQITELTKQIDYCLEQQLSLSNWMEIKEIAQNAASIKLEQAAVIYGLFSFKSMKPEFVPNINKLFWYLSHPYLDIESELQVFEFGLKWIEHQDMGADALLIILCCLDMNRITKEELKSMKDLIKDYVNSITEKIIDCLCKLSSDYELSLAAIKQHKQILCELYTVKVYTEVLNLVKESINRKLKFTPAVPMWSNKDKTPEKSPNYLFTYSEDQGFKKWMEVAETNLWGWNIASWSSTKIVVVCGEYGRGTGIFMKDVKVYDIHKSEWVQHGVQLPVRRHAGVVIVDDSLYILGGVGGFRERPSLISTKMSTNTCMNYCAWNMLRLRGHSLREAPESMSNIIFYSLRSKQVSGKRYLCASCYSNLQVKSENIPEQRLLPACLGPRHVCVTCDMPKALVPLETPKKPEVIEWTFPYLINYLRKMFFMYWLAAKRRVNMCNRSNKSSEHNKSTQRAIHRFHGIDMRPARPKRKEKPIPPEIPEPGIPGENLPGFPVPGFPDVAIPIVPELPMPELPEIPLPQEPGKPRPKGKPLPGDPIPILQDMLRQRWPFPILQDLIRQRFPLPVPAFQDASIALCSPSIQSPLERNKVAEYIMKSNKRQLSEPRNGINKKYEIPKGLIVPPMVKDLLKNDKIYAPTNELISTLSKLTPAEMDAVLYLLEKHRQTLKSDQEMYNDYIYGLNFEQFQEVFNFVCMLKKQREPSKILVNKLNIPSQLFIKNAKFLSVEEEQYYKGIFTGKIEIKNRKYFKRF